MDQGVFEDGFLPNMFVDISDYLERKIEILKIIRKKWAKHHFREMRKRFEGLLHIGKPLQDVDMLRHLFV